MFADTYSLEHSVNKKRLSGLPGKIAFARDSGDHESLCAGRGKYASDFYCWDDAANKWHSWVEFKHWGTADIEAAKKYYSDKRYKARYVIVVTQDGKYYLIDYSSGTVTLQEKMRAPDKLLIWNDESVHI